MPPCVGRTSQYIGELCRYLLAVEPSPLDRQNELRVAIGNGLRPDIWEKVCNRNTNREG